MLMTYITVNGTDKQVFMPITLTVFITLASNVFTVGAQLVFNQ